MSSSAILLALPIKVAAISTGLDRTAGAAGVKQEGSIAILLGGFISRALGLVGVVFVVLMIYGGALWMTAAGNEERIKKARQVLTGSIIGIVIIFGSYAITDFVLQALLPDDGS